jgi:hypothetical protein
VTAASHPDDVPASQAIAKLAEPNEPDTASPGTPGGQLASPVLQGGIALIIYLVIWVSTAFWRIASHATQMLLMHTSQDPNLNVWSLSWWPYAIGNVLNPLYTHQIFARAGHSLAWVTTTPPLALLAAPLTVAASPVLAFNVLASLALPLAAWAAFLLCRRLTGKFWAGLAGGAVFGFSAFETYHSAMGQLNLAYSLLLPILGYIIVVWWQGRISTRAFVIFAAITLAVQFYLFLEVFADLAGILAIALVAGFGLAERARRPVIVRLAKSIGLAYGIAIVLALPYVVYMLNSTTPRPLQASGADLASLVIPRPGRALGIGWLAHAAAGPGKLSAACYVGIPLLVLVILLAVTSWQSRLVRFLSCMLAIIVVVSLGPVFYLEGRPSAVPPWAGLFRLPLVRNAYPLRLMEFAYLALAVATALWLAGPAKRVQWARWPLAVLVILSIALDAAPIKDTTHNEVPTFISEAQYRRQLSPGEIVVVISNVGNAAMLWQAQSGFYMRIAGGYINQDINHGTDLPAQVHGLTSPTPSHIAKFERFVKAAHVGAILLDRGRGDVPKWVGVFSHLGLVGHTTGGVVVYPTDGCRTCRRLAVPEPAKKTPATAQQPSAIRRGSSTSRRDLLAPGSPRAGISAKPAG